FAAAAPAARATSAASSKSSAPVQLKTTAAAAKIPSVPSKNSSTLKNSKIDDDYVVIPTVDPKPPPKPEGEYVIIDNCNPQSIKEERPEARTERCGYRDSLHSAHKNTEKAGKTPKGRSNPSLPAPEAATD
ncbi:hypothetical protein PFISCL1PPCAC_29060, partial [Pristionchus fissidentatus]